MADHNYTAASVKSLDWKEHIRLRPGMYIGKLGDGSSDDDGIYVLMKEVMDNCIDEFVMGFGKTIEVECDGQPVIVRAFGRGDGEGGDEAARRAHVRLDLGVWVQQVPAI